MRNNIDSRKILKNFKLKQDIEERTYCPGVLFWSAKTSALTKSTMLKLSSSPLYQDMTVRAPNTVHKIYELMQRQQE